MKAPAIIRIIFIALLALFVIERISGTPNQWDILENPVLLLVWAATVIFMFAIEVSVVSLQRLLFYSLSEEAKGRYLAKEAEKQNTWKLWLSKIYSILVGKKKARSEEEIILDHNYDGIKELDNNLPPWWLYGFYATIIFAVVYMVRYHVFDGPTQEDEYRTEVAAANKSIEAYKKTAKDLVDASSVEMLTDAEDLKKGETIFNNNCAACHRTDGGGGIGPNLTDNYWILGGSISDIFQVISEGGRPGKGMISWKSDLRPVEIAQVASYILTLQGTNPPEAKAPEGDLYESDATPTEENTEKETSGEEILEAAASK